MHHPIVLKRHTKTYIWNVEDLENPVLLNTYVGPVTSIDHNQYIVGDYVSTDVVFGLLLNKHMTNTTSSISMRSTSCVCTMSCGGTTSCTSAHCL